MSTITRSLPLDLSLATPVAAGRLTALFAGAEKLLDFLAVLSAVYVALALYQCLEPQRAAAFLGTSVFLWTGAFALLFVFLLERHGGYRPSVSLLAIRETERILRVTLQASLLAILMAYLCAAPVPRLAFVLSATTIPLFLTLEKWEVHNLLRMIRGKGYGARRAIILGTGPEGRRVFSALLRSPKFGVDPVAFIDDDPQTEVTEIYESTYHGKRSAEVLAGPICPQLFRQLHASVLVIATSAMDRESLLTTIAKAGEAGVTAYFAPGDSFGPGYWVDYAELDGVMLAHLSQGTSRVLYEFVKRALDMFGAFVLLLGLALAVPVIALLVKLTSPGPVFFGQERVGKNGRHFHMYKFRTMYCDAPHYGYSPGSGDDPRLTPFGRLLRRASLDELPQAFNVLLGQMSLVGPRPEMPFIVEKYTAWERQRLAVKPGMTGLWQISPARVFPIHEHLEYDQYYVCHRSLFMDVAILLHTVLFAARGI